MGQASLYLTYMTHDLGALDPSHLTVTTDPSIVNNIVTRTTSGVRPLVFITALNGFRYIFVRAPWQRAYLAIFAAYLGTVGESFIIDTDHWRHFWMMMGAIWGMFAAAQTYRASSGPMPVRHDISA